MYIFLCHDIYNKRRCGEYINEKGNQQNQKIKNNFRSTYTLQQKANVYNTTYQLFLSTTNISSFYILLPSHTFRKIITYDNLHEI